MEPVEGVAKQNILAGKSGTLARRTFPLSLKGHCNVKSLDMEI